ncbi:MAG: hypothetical protein AAB706_00290 [Patescibacteria group bacterium]
MPPQKIPTTNTTGNIPPIAQKENEATIAFVENKTTSPLQKEISKEFSQTENVKNSVTGKENPEKNKLDRLGDRLNSKNPFEMFTRQREISQIPTVIPKAIDNKPTRIQDLMKSKYSNYPIKPLRTYRGDVEESIQNKKTSIVSIAVAEKKRQIERGETPKVKRDVPQNTLAIALSTILVIAGIGSLFIFLYAKYEQDRAIVILYTQTIIPADASKQLILTPQATEKNTATLKESIMGTQEKIGSIVYFDLVERKEKENAPLGVVTLLSLIAPSVPSYLERSFENEYMLGLYIPVENEPFLILKTNSYETAFSGMLAWEETLIHELGPLFIKDMGVLPETSGKKLFGDHIVKNKDTRVVKDMNGNIVFLYSFLDKETIIITTKEDVLLEILGRYLNSKLVR